MSKLKLHWQILIAMVLGIAIGVIFQNIHHGNPDGAIYSLITSLGVIFVRLLKMVIVPLVFTSIIMGISSIKDQSKIGRLGLKTLVYYIFTSLIAIFNKFLSAHFRNFFQFSVILYYIYYFISSSIFFIRPNLTNYFFN